MPIQAAVVEQKVLYFLNDPMEMGVPLTFYNHSWTKGGGAMNHRRDDDEGQTFEHVRNNDMPAWLGWGLEAVQKVGFPAVMCLLIWWRSETTEKQLSYSMQKQASTLETLVGTEKDLVVTINTNHVQSNERWEHFLAEFRASRK